MAEGDASTSDGLVPGRSCGECAVCCQHVQINVPELRKPAGIRCPHSSGYGCTVYETRPGVCRSWYCAWRQIAAFPDWMRPDRCGVMFVFDENDPPHSPFDRVYVTGLLLDAEAGAGRPTVQAAFQTAIATSPIPVFMGRDGAHTLVHPDPPLRDAILNPWTTVWQHRVPEALAWRRRLGLSG
jgi:hypothetical protein